MSRRRNLSDDEHALWTGFARSIKPLRPAKAMPKESTGPSAEPAVAGGHDPHEDARDRPTPSHSPLRQGAAPAAKPLPLAPFERRFKQRVARGRHTIDARIDLHGMTQRQAHAALLSFLRHAQAADAKVALVVTGKGTGKNSDDTGERGVLRRQVPVWLALPEFRRFVVGFDEAHLGHGGEGALYVRVRRVR
jgi:DNA-nicking Smr family endonuclease